MKTAFARAKAPHHIRRRHGIDNAVSLQYHFSVPPKIRELINRLKKAGFADRGGKGSHRNFTHPNSSRPVVLSGNPGDDAKPYQIRQVQAAIEESEK
jgi:predicted RNA binding protein YcfA (HicA-like mRNA interferase family)